MGCPEISSSSDHVAACVLASFTLFVSQARCISCTPHLAPRLFFSHLCPRVSSAQSSHSSRCIDPTSSFRPIHPHALTHAFSPILAVRRTERVFDRRIAEEQDGRSAKNAAWEVDGDCCGRVDLEECGPRFASSASQLRSARSFSSLLQYISSQCTRRRS